MRVFQQRVQSTGERLKYRCICVRERVSQATDCSKESCHGRVSLSDVTEVLRIPVLETRKCRHLVRALPGGREITFDAVEVGIGEQVAKRCLSRQYPVSLLARQYVIGGVRWLEKTLTQGLASRACPRTVDQAPERGSTPLWGRQHIEVLKRCRVQKHG